MLNSSETFRRESVNGDARVKLQQPRNGRPEGVVVGQVVLLNVIQKGNSQRIDCRGADWLCRLLRRGACGRPFGDASGIILVGFGSAEFAEINPVAIDSNEGGASVIAHLRWA